MVYLSRTHWVLVAVVSSATAIVGCRHDEPNKGSEGVSVSPKANPSAAAAGAVRAKQTRRVGRPAEEADARAPSRGNDAQPRSASAQVGQDEDELRKKEEKEHAARRRTEASLNKALKGAFGSMQRCYEGAKSASAQTTLKFRLHRSGYLVNPQVNSGSSRIDACVRGVLDRVRVVGVETDSLTLERTVQFTSQPRQ